MIGAKRKLRLAPLLALLALVMAGCTAPQAERTGHRGADAGLGSAAAPVEIVFWNPFGGGEGDYAEQIVRSFNASQKDVFVKQLRLESNEYYVKLSTALSSGKGPDVAVAHADRISPFVKAKQIMPIETAAQETPFDFGGIAAANMQSVTFAGKPYAVPLDTHFHMLYYNKDILSKAGLLQEDGTPMLGDSTPEGFIRMLRTIREKMPDVQPLAVNTPYFQEPFLNFYYQAGGELLNADATKAAIHNEQARRVLAFYEQLFAERLADLNDKTPWDSFHNGKAALWFGGVWEAGHHLSEKSLSVGIVPLPVIFGSRAQWGSSHTLVVPAYVTKEKQRAAMAFIRYFSGAGESIWGQAGHVPANAAVAQSADYQALPYRKLFLESKRYVKLAPQTDKYATIFTALSEDLQTIILSGADPEEGLADLEKKMNEILAN